MNDQRISNAQIKHIRQLQLKKYRQRYNEFMVEGTKSVLEFVQSSLKCKGIYALDSWFNEFSHESAGFNNYISSEKELAQISALKNAQQVVAIFEIPKAQKVEAAQKVILALDDIRDPGNLGTIIRSADWFGLSQIVCSKTCADCYNPKVVQSSMGSLSRVNVIYEDILGVKSSLPEHSLTIAHMEGQSLAQFKWTKNLLVIGNEGRGVSDEIKAQANEMLSIDRIGQGESLNAAISCSIILHMSFL